MALTLTCCIRCPGNTRVTISNLHPLSTFPGSFNTALELEKGETEKGTTTHIFLTVEPSMAQSILHRSVNPDKNLAKSYYNSILQTMNLRYREVKSLAQGHPARKKHSQGTKVTVRSLHIQVSSQSQVWQPYPLRSGLHSSMQSHR